MGAHASSNPSVADSPQSVNTTSMQVPGGALQSGPHTRLPEDPSPFVGPKLDYLMVSISAKRRSTDKHPKHSTPMIAADQDPPYPALLQPYEDGFKLNKFQTIPGLDSREVQYQGIFTRPVETTCGGGWNLNIVKSYIKPQEFFSITGWSTDEEGKVSSHVQTKIQEMAKKGARFLCLEPTGPHTKYTDPSLSSDTDQTVVGVDLFFHLPRNPDQSLCVYQSMNVPITYSMIHLQGGWSMYDVLYECHTDLTEQLSSVLCHGWKLVDIYLDTLPLTKSNAFASGQLTVNSMWFFEKETKDSKDSTACWEGTIIYYQHQVKSSKHGKKLPKHTWDPILIEMGQRGWELACIVETPETRQTGSSTKTTTLLLFFQRRVISPAS